MQRSRTAQVRQHRPSAPPGTARSRSTSIRDRGSAAGDGELENADRLPANGLLFAVSPYLTSGGLLFPCQDPDRRHVSDEALLIADSAIDQVRVA
jgi:hypothetical protein